MLSRIYAKIKSSRIKSVLQYIRAIKKNNLGLLRLVIMYQYGKCYEYCKPKNQSIKSSALKALYGKVPGDKFTIRQSSCDEFTY